MARHGIEILEKQNQKVPRNTGVASLLMTESVTPYPYEEETSLFNRPGRFESGNIKVQLVPSVQERRKVQALMQETLV